MNTVSDFVTIRDIIRILLGVPQGTILEPKPEVIKNNQVRLIWDSLRSSLQTLYL